MSAKVRVALSGALLVAAGIAAVLLWRRSPPQPAARHRVSVVILDRWQGGVGEPSGSEQTAATTKVVESLPREPGDSLVIVRYDRWGGYTQMLGCSESTVGADAGWPADEVPPSWEVETCVTHGLERAASYLAKHDGERRIVIVSDDPNALSKDVDALIARITATGIAISRSSDHIEELRAALR